MGRRVVAFASVALAVSLAACAPAGGDAGTPGRLGRATTGGPAVTATGPKQANLLTGSQLKTLLLDQADMPSGFKLNPQWAADSGRTVYPALSERATPPSARQCGRLTGVPWLSAAGVPPVSFAANGYEDADRNEIDQMAAVYQEATAGRAAMANLRKLFAMCASFTAATSGRRARVILRMSAGPQVGNESIRAVMTSSAWQGGETLVAVRVAGAIAAVDYSSTAADMGASAVSLVTMLVARIRAAA